MAVVPRAIDLLKKSQIEVWVEAGAGNDSGFPDSEYAERGGHVATKDEVRKQPILLHVRVPETPVGAFGSTAIGLCDPLTDLELVSRYAQAGITLFSLEFVPRITRAQSMDVLSSMASIAGYKAVLIAANALPRMFPMMTTAAGSIAPARVLVIGAGVAGLQAIATARRLGSVVSGYDVRSAVKEQIESLGAKFVNIDLGGAKGEGEGGYARALDDETIRKQREQMAAVMREQDVVITTAAVPGRKAPLLVTREMVHAMRPGTVIVDLAAERGGNCELTRAGETVNENGVQIIGPTNVPSTVPYHASQMYARNIATFLKNMVTKDGQLNIDIADEITRESLVTRGGEVVNPRVQALLPVKA